MWKHTLPFLFACSGALFGKTAARSVIIGDSLFWSGALFWGGQPSPLSKTLETYAGHPIENHALVGASLEDGWVKSIRNQYNELDKSHPEPITTLIMDGGGNDVVSHRKDCEAFNEACRSMLNTSLAIAGSILEDAERDGIHHVLYLGFYYLPGLKDAVDVGNTRMAALCAGSATPCVFIDPRYNETSGEGLPTPTMLGSDGLHPNSEGYKLLADMIWEAKLAHDIPV